MFEQYRTYLMNLNKSNLKLTEQDINQLIAYRVKRNGPTCKYFKKSDNKDIPTFAPSTPNFWRRDIPHFKSGISKPKQGWHIPSSRWW